jgi:hypothetical protein
LRILGEHSRPLFRPKLVLFGAAFGEPLTSAVEDEHLDFTDRGHGELARLVGEQAVALEHGLV